MKLKCAICQFNPIPGQGPEVRNAEFVWEGVSVCDRHIKERRAQLFHQAEQQGKIPGAGPPKPPIEIP